jgi:putative membrane protein
VKRALLSPRVAEEEVLERALRAFQDLGLHRTRDRTGVLILVSLLERRVQVLADTGINARVKPGAWDRVVRTILAGIRNGDLSTGLCEGIAACGEILAAEFPILPGDRNELANDLRKG